MNNKNKISNLGYQLATIIIELMLLILFNINILYLLRTINMKILMKILIIKILGFNYVIRLKNSIELS